VDRTSMQNSLEARSPFLDFRLIEYVFNLPDAFKMDSRSQKKILKETFAPLLPKGHFDLPKLGFGIPIGDFLNHELQGEMKSLLGDPAIRESGLVNTALVEKMYQGHTKGVVRSFQLWTFFVFAAWLKKNAAIISEAD